MKGFILTVTLLLTTIGSAHSQASLAAENMVSDMVVNVNNTQKTYTVVRDENVPTQWYYIPNAIRFADNVTASGRREPKISIIKYQYKDRNKNDSIFEGGNMEFSVTFAAEPTAIEQMLSNLRAMKGDNKIQLSCLPLKSSTLSFINRNRVFLGEGFEPKEELGPLMSSQELAFSIPLTAVGADVFEAMVKNAGFAMNAKVHYNGIMPPCGFEVKGVWENLYRYFSEHQSLAVDAGWMGTWWGFGGSYKNSKDSVKRSLTNSASIRVSSVGCQNTSDDSIMNKHIDMIVAKLKYEPFNDSINKMMDTLLLNNAFKTDDEKKSILRQFWGGVSWNSSIKNVELQRKDSIDIKFEKKSIVDRFSHFGSTLGIGHYGLSEEELKNKYVIEIKAGDWNKAIFGLPQATSLYKDMGIRQMTLNISYKGTGGNIPSESAQWNPEDGWMKKGKKCAFLNFALMGEKKNLNDLEFEAKLDITPDNGKGFQVNRKIKAFNGESNFAAIDQMIETIVVDGSNLSFARMTNNNNDLDIVDISLSYGSENLSQSIKYFSKDGVAGYPKPLVFVIPKQEKVVELNVLFRPRTGEDISWKANGQIKKNHISLLDKDWKKN